MKTAISLPDAIFELATGRAKSLGISRSELIARALQAYLREHQAAEVKASYDRAFGEPDMDTDDTSTHRRAAARRALAKIEW